MDAVYAADQITSFIGAASTVTGKEIRDVTMGFYDIFPENRYYPFLALSSKLRAIKACKNPKKEWGKKRLFPEWDRVVTGAVAGTSASIVITTAGKFKVHDTIKFPDATVASGQTNVGIVTAKTTVTLTVSPVGETNLCAVSNGEWCQNLSDASGDTSTMPGIKLVKDEMDYNYIQFLRVPAGVGVIKNETAQYTGISEMVERDNEIFRFIKSQAENVLIWGERDVRTATTGGNTTYNDYQYFQRGLWTWVEKADGDNIATNTLTMTESQFDEFMLTGPAFGGSDDRWMFASGEWLNHLTGWGKSKERITQRVKIMGLNFTQYQLPNGKMLHITTHNKLVNSYAGAFFMVDPMAMDFVPFSSMGAFQFHANIQDNDLAGVANEYRILFTNQVPFTEWHAIGTN